MCLWSAPILQTVCGQKTDPTLCGHALHNNQFLPALYAPAVVCMRSDTSWLTSVPAHLDILPRGADVYGMSHIAHFRRVLIQCHINCPHLKIHNDYPLHADKYVLLKNQSFLPYVFLTVLVHADTSLMYPDPQRSASEYSSYPGTHVPEHIQNHQNNQDNNISSQ